MFGNYAKVGKVTNPGNGNTKPIKISATGSEVQFNTSFLM